MAPIGFDEKHVLHELVHYLPSQTPLKDFIHHNSLHAFQHLKFYDAIFKASKIFGYQVTLELSDYRKLLKSGRINEEILNDLIIQHKGEELLNQWRDKLINKEYNEIVIARIGRVRSEWKKKYKIDIDSLVQPLLFRILCSYLDQGISLWNFP
ncbi:MAG TPA: Na-translocating system protein MpsB, partial [Chitinophagaceae bacterium]|nr:Na-translocating system protein MpsB [Chitinophagaceae bacterium]